MTASSNLFAPDADTSQPLTMFGPDFPFSYDEWLAHKAGLGSVPAHRHGEEVAIIGAGMAG
ncbi:MAG: amine oxidase, partial [Rhizobiales bacterium]|nr:amine oxidase [Hyphomicrobiales bacterium]